MDKTQIRDAATILLVRDPDAFPSVLMGQRGARAAFMPSKFVFPGGAVDPQDSQISFAGEISRGCAGRLAEDASEVVARALPATAIRELWEETGLVLGRSGTLTTPPPDWEDFAAQGACPDASSLAFFFRAITPPGRPRRFDARFFLAPATSVLGDLDDFSRASDELSNLQWVPLSDARRFDLPFITEVVLAELTQRLPDLSPGPSVPFFRNSDEESLFERLGGQAL